MKPSDLANGANKNYKLVRTSGPMKFRKLRSGGYQLLEDYWAQSPLLAGHPCKSEDGTVEQTENGVMILKAGFISDGPSGPTIDTDDFLPGAFIHDGGYLLCREGKVPRKKWRKIYDIIIVEIAKEKGMGWFRRKYVYFFLRTFAGFAAEPKADEEKKVRIIP